MDPGLRRDDGLESFDRTWLLAQDACSHVRRCGSTMSRRPSPIRLKQNTAAISTRPGNSATHHSPDTIKLAPSATMMPHSAVGGRTPRPINDRPAALRIAYPSVSETCTIINGRMFG